MKLTFRTEGFNDGERVPVLLESVGLSECLINRDVLKDPVNENWEMDVFSLELPDGTDIEEVRSKLETKIYGDDRFIDMHRCAQTLAVGDEPDEEWFRR